MHLANLKWTEHHRVYHILHCETQQKFGDQNNIAQVVEPNVDNEDDYNNDDLHYLDLDFNVAIEENNGEKQKEKKQMMWLSYGWRMQQQWIGVIM
jgi:hypothetical protein